MTVSTSGKGDSEPRPRQSPRVDILLATYNGAPFLSDLLRSIAGQRYTNWRIIARDDGSTDGTVPILEEAASKFGPKMLLLRDDEGSLGATQNFARLLSHATADYAMFCDQDDIWLPDKIGLTLDAMRSEEERAGRTTPILIFTDLEVVDEKLRPIAISLWRYRGIDPDGAGKLSRALLANGVTGCTMMLNAALRALANPIPLEARVHDWWVVLVASAMGKTAYLAEPTILYRQHGGNVVGARRVWSLQKLILFVLGSRRRRRRVREHLAASYRQARALAERLAPRMDPARSALVEAFIRSEAETPMGRALEAARFDIRSSGWLDTLAYIVLSAADRADRPQRRRPSDL